MCWRRRPIVRALTSTGMDDEFEYRVHLALPKFLQGGQSVSDCLYRYRQSRVVATPVGNAFLGHSATELEAVLQHRTV